MTKNFKLNDKEFFYNTVNFIFTLCFARFALSLDKKGCTSESKVENFIFALCFTRFALSLQKFLINKSSNYDK